LPRGTPLLDERSLAKTKYQKVKWPLATHDFYAMSNQVSPQQSALLHCCSAIVDSEKRTLATIALATRSRLQTSHADGSSAIASARTAADRR
jgi:hypothetical protein